MPTATELKVATREYVCGPEGQGGRSLLFFEVWVEGRRADAISVDLWGSRGHRIKGFEVKVSRQDWLNEIRNPEKAAPAVAVCDRFYLVAPPEIIRPGELPEHWGHLAPKPGWGLRVIKRAPKLAPLGPGRDFWTTLMKRAWWDGRPNDPYVPLEVPDGH